MSKQRNPQRILEAKLRYQNAQRHFFEAVMKGDGSNIEDARLEYKKATTEYHRRIRR